VSLANASLGRPPLDGVEQVGPDAYVIAPSLPPTLRDVGISPAVAASKP